MSYKSSFGALKDAGGSCPGSSSFIKIRIMGISKTSDYIQNKIKMPNPIQEPQASSKAPNEDLNDMDVLCTFKIKIESPNSDHGCVKDKWP